MVFIYTSFDVRLVSPYEDKASFGCTVFVSNGVAGTMLPESHVSTQVARENHRVPTAAWDENVHGSHGKVTIPHSRAPIAV
jgi:hypothetical protein